MVLGFSISSWLATTWQVVTSLTREYASTIVPTDNAAVEFEISYSTSAFERHFSLLQLPPLRRQLAGTQQHCIWLEPRLYTVFSAVAWWGSVRSAGLLSTLGLYAGSSAMGLGLMYF
ncbi:hypothetical protein V8E53_014887 [Lactarius tabidus]